jgi:hypothetical protein
MTPSSIHRSLLSNDQRIDLPAELFGAVAFPFKVEPTIFHMAGMLAAKYRGGFWDMFQLSNGGWYMSPAQNTLFVVSSRNGFSGSMTADALGITACLFAFSDLSFGGDDLAEACAAQYHLLREFALDHFEARHILSTID